jgi:hypothetical protein
MSFAHQLATLGFCLFCLTLSACIISSGSRDNLDAGSQDDADADAMTSCGLGASICSDLEYCDYEPSAICGADDQTGTCKARPTACDGTLEPVCGCDGRNYTNACSAHAAGTAVASAGVCDGSSMQCGGPYDIFCESDQYCAYGEFSPCGLEGAFGSCIQRPIECLDRGEPVCGCNAVSYDSACEAHADGVSVIALGPC